MLPVQAARWRRLHRPLLLRSRIVFPTSLALVVVASAASSALALPPCSDSGPGWCLARRITGDVPGGELGFRFGEPLDADGDGRADIAAGSRFKLADRVLQNGAASVWSVATGAKIREWDGTLAKGLFGHSVLPVADLDGDALADVVIAAPSAEVDGEMHGVLSARSPRSGDVLWRLIARREEHLGWDMAPAGDQDGDGKADVFAGSPSAEGGRVYLVSGRDGSVLRTYAPPVFRASFGWYVASTGDLDGDGRADVVVGNLQGASAPGDARSIVYLLSAASGAVLREWSEDDPARAFGEVVAGIGDLDGDGRGDIAIASPHTSDAADAAPGDVQVFSGADGRELRRWSGKQNGERYGRMATSAGDVDGDGTDDVAIGAPRHRVGERQFVGRVEVRSGKTGAVIAGWFGQDADDWFGWHIRRAPHPDGPALLIGSLRRNIGGHPGTGVLDLYVLKR